MTLQNAIGAEGETSVPAQTTENQPTEQTRRFAIIELPAGANPWDLGRLKNVQEVLGYGLLEWLLPLKRSPCASHNDPMSMFKLGPAVDEAVRKAGLVEGRDAEPSRKRSRRRRSDAGDERRSRRHRSHRKDPSSDRET